jgi:hypothetical protein
MQFSQQTAISRFQLSNLKTQYIQHDTLAQKIFKNIQPVLARSMLFIWSRDQRITK